MALTQEQWFSKLKSFVPNWWFEQEVYNAAVFEAMAKMLYEADANIDAHLAETFILQAGGEFLDAHGQERGISREVGELDAAYAPRVQNLISSPDPISIKALVDSLLLVGQSTVREHMINGAYFDGDSFFNRRQVFTDIQYDTFSIVFDYQGNTAEADAVRAQIASSVNKVKAMGTLYRITERKA